MAQTIKIKRSSTSGNKLTSSNSVAGELGLNTADKALYIQTGSTNGDVVTIAHESTLKIDEVNGRIGIGTTTPDEALVVSGDGARIYVNSADYHVAMIGRRGSSGTSLDQGYIRLKDQGTNKVVLDTAGSSYFTGGNVGIGTTSPGVKLDIKTTGGYDYGIRVGSEQGNSKVITYADVASSPTKYNWIAGAQYNINDGFEITPSTAVGGYTFSAPAVVVLQSGNVGIGKTNPLQKLNVHGKISSNIATADHYYGAWLDGNSTSGQDSLLGLGTWHNNAGYVKFFQSSAPDRLAIYTANTSDHVTLQESGGNVGIGTTSPAQKLHVKAGASGATTFDSRHNIILEDDGENYLGFYTPNNSFSGLRFVNADSSIRAHIDYYHGTQGDKFVMYSQEGWEFTYPSYGVQQVLKKNGNVGIRATNPPHDLTIYNASGPTLYLVGGGYNDDVRIAFGGGDTTNTSGNGNTGAQIISTQSAVSGQARGNLKFLTNGGDLLEERLRITEDGNVGIGTTNPVYTLVVSEDGNDNIEIGAGIIQRYNRSSSAYQAMNYNAYSHNFYTTGGGQQSLFIKNDGNVGIGTSTPYSGTNVKSLTVNATSYPALALQIGGNNAGLLMSNSSGTDLYALGNKRLQFKTNDTTRIKIAGTGEVTFNEEYTFPTSDGSANQVLKTDGSGNLSFVTIAGAGAITEIEDADGDTKIQVEESSDEDKIRFDIAGTERVVVDGTDFIVDNIALKVKDPGGTFSWNVNKYGYNTTRSSSITQLSATGDHANVPLSVLADVNSTRTASYVEIGDIGSAGNRFKIDNTGRVGIKTTPSAWTTDYAVIDLNTGGSIYGTTSGISTSSNLYFNGSSWLAKTTGLGTLYAAYSGQHIWYSSASVSAGSAASLSTKMILDSAGRLGIGTSSPSKKLHVYTSDNEAIFMQGTASGVWMDMQVPGGDLHSIGAQTNGMGIYNRTSSAYRFFITDAGNVGIGTTAPASNFHVKTSVDNSVSQGIVVERSLNSDRGYINYTGGAFQFRSTVGDPIVFGETDAEHMRILPDGNVGIGTTAPAGRLDIQENSTGSILTRVWNTNTSGTGESVLRIANNGNNAQGSRLEFTDQQYYHSSISADRTNGIQFGTNATGSTGVATERMRLNSNGDWMVSNTVANVASAYSTQGGCGWVESDNHFEAATTSNRSAAEFGRNNANSGDVITIRQQGTSVGMIGTEGGDSLVIQSNGSTGSGLRFHPSGASIQPVRAGVTIDNTISLGADTRRFKDLHLSNAANIGHASIETSSTSTTATTQVAIATFAAATFRGAEFTIQVTNSTDSTYHLTKVLLIHDGTTPGITEYGTVFTGSAAEATFDADISSGNVRLLATPASTDSMTFKVVRHCITV